jgi:RNA 2',3'-cyclic 3'-phosphodiesterase
VRLFVALEIPPAVRENLADLIKELRAHAPQPRWVRAENLHLTLKFIGEAPPAKLDPIRRALSTVRSNQSLVVQFRGLGFFPNEKYPRILWANMEAPPSLKFLAVDIDHALEKLGIPHEQRPFVPHLTLARFQPPGLTEKLRNAAHENAARDFGTLETKEFYLIESKLKSGGAEYTTLESFSFATAEG